MANAGYHAEILVNEYELTSVSTDLEMSTAADELESNGFGSPVKTFCKGLIDSSATLDGFMRGDAHVALSAPSNSHIVAFLIGVGAAPVIGDASYSGETFQPNYSVTPPRDNLVVVNAMFKDTDSLSSLGWGNIIGKGKDLTVTGIGASWDSLEATLNGSRLQLNVTKAEFTGGPLSYTVEVEHSPTGSSWATLTVFAVAGGTTAEVKTTSGNVDRHLRVKHVISGAASVAIDSTITLVRNRV